MTTAHYKKLGPYIQPINIRNKDAEKLPLMGLSINKIFIPSIANTIGTNMKNYKIIERNQFAYGPVTSRNGDKITIALFEDYDKALISQAYIPFEVIDKNKLNPEYLMMWFRRTEFDRYARYNSHGSVREIFDWNEMCEVELPIPSIEKQNEIVKEYNTVVNRITLNEQLNKKLEETAQALYKHWFVDFEFPDAEGKPYKSSDGEMVYNEELDKEIPVGWSVELLGNIIESFSKKHNFNKAELIFFNTSDILEGEFLHNNYSDVSKMPGQAKKQIKKWDILYSEIRPKNKRYALVRVDAEDYVVSTKLMVLRIKKERFSVYRLYHFLTESAFVNELQFSAEGRSGTFPQITFEGDIENKPFLIANKETEKKWSDLLKNYFDQHYARIDENKILKKVEKLLLSKMTRVEVEKELTN